MGGDHSYRASSQKDADGAGNDGSLNAPTGIPNRVEPVSRVQQIVTPQVGQKWWLIRVPALLVRVYILLGPFRRTVSFGKYALLVHGTPDRRWQSRQWHTLTTIGSAETMTLKAPHRHLAVLGIFVVFLSGQAAVHGFTKRASSLSGNQANNCSQMRSAGQPRPPPGECNARL
jgi:hypothetical protein